MTSFSILRHTFLNYFFLLLFLSSSFVFAFSENGAPSGQATPQTQAQPTGSTPTGESTSGMLGLSGQSFCGTKIVPDPSIKELIKTNLEAASAGIPEFETPLKAAYGEYEGAWASCHNKASDAQTLCMEQCSPQIQTGVTALNGIAAAAKGAGGTSTQCGSAASILNIVQGALSAFQVACGGAKALCHGTCETALKALSKMQSELPKLKTKLETSKATVLRVCATQNSPIDPEVIKYIPLLTSPCSAATSAQLETVATRLRAIEAATQKINLEKTSGTNTTIAAREKACQGYTMQLVTAGGSLATMLALKSQAEKCEKETEAVDCTKSENFEKLDCVCRFNPQAAGCPGDCAKEANKTKTECMCLANPRLPGCPNNLDKTNSSGAALDAPAINAIGANSTSGGDVNLGSGDLANMDAPPGGSGVDGGGGLSGGGGGGPGLGGSGSSGNAGTRAAAGGAAGGRYSANVLSGEGGGGGGGWGSGGGSGSGLRSYLPGGARDPNARAPNAATVAPAAQITTSAGRSNFEKVSDRYQDNRQSLLTNR